LRDVVEVLVRRTDDHLTGAKMIRTRGGQTRPLAVVVLLAAVGFGFLAWWIGRGKYTRQPSDAVLECRRWYAAAATFKDTVAVDLKYPTAYWQKATSRRGPQTCGDLRTSGRLW